MAAASCHAGGFGFLPPAGLGCQARARTISAAASAKKGRPISRCSASAIPTPDQLKAVVRYGELTVAPGGASAVVSYPAEEQMYFVTEEAQRTLFYGDEKAPIKANSTSCTFPPG